jgi:hypothetical protein
VVEQVAAAVADAAVRSGVAQRDASRSADVTDIYR